MPVDRDSLPLPESHVIFRAMPDGAVLLSSATEVYYGLNAVGTQVWELLPTHRTLDAMCAELGQRYPDAEPEMIRADVAELLDTLVEFGLLRHASTGTPPLTDADASRPAQGAHTDASRVG
jgi:hypothetical protein